MIHFSCPGCHAVHIVASQMANKAGQCPKCHALFLIPAADTRQFMPTGGAQIPRAVTGGLPIPRCKQRPDPFCFPG